MSLGGVCIDVEYCIFDAETKTSFFKGDHWCDVKK